MTLSSNQFSIRPVKGDSAFGGATSVYSFQVSPSQTTPLVAGQAVKLEDSAGSLPKVLALASNAEEAFGFVLRNLKDASAPASSVVEVATNGMVIFMESGGAIARGADVEVVNSTVKVIAAAGINPKVGVALDKATADGQVIRVLIKFDIAEQATLKTATVTATLAQINAGLVLIPSVAGRQIRVVSFVQRVTGTFTTTTSVDLQSTNASPVKVVVAAVAGLGSGAILIPGSANTTLGAGFSVPLGAGDGLAVANVGAAAAGGTSIAFTINYTQA